MTLFNSAEVEQVLLPNVRDLGDGFQVRRALPSAQRRMVGPFIFLDSFGPVTFRAGEGLDSRPHPHIGLSTLTYLSMARSFTATAKVTSRRSARVRSI